MFSLAKYDASWWKVQSRIETISVCLGVNIPFVSLLEFCCEASVNQWPPREPFSFLPVRLLLLSSAHPSCLLAFSLFVKLLFLLWLQSVSLTAQRVIVLSYGAQILNKRRVRMKDVLSKLAGRINSDYRTWRCAWKTKPHWLCCFLKALWLLPGFCCVPPWKYETGSIFRNNFIQMQIKAKYISKMT